MIIGSFQFIFHWRITAVFLVLLAALLSLGIWQLNRAEQKRQLLDAFTHQAQQDAVDLAEYLYQGDEILYRSVVAHGRYNPDANFLLDNQMHQGRVGYHVLTPLYLERDFWILVNRGWIPLGKDRADLPAIETPNQALTVSGRLSHFPDVGYRLEPPKLDPSRWPKVVQYVDRETIDYFPGRSLIPFVIQLHPEEDFGFNRDWQYQSLNPQRHSAYAVQWFAIAAILIIVYLALSLQRGTGRENIDEEKR